MSNAQPEPSMEEILASIRRIISEDEEEPAPKPTPRVEPVRAAAPEPVRPAVVPPRPAPAPEPTFATEDVEMIRKNVAEAMDDEDGIVASETATAASKAFMSLSQTVQVSDGRGRTMEDIVIELLRPMIKDWLDQNLATIVEEKVEEEVQRVARRRR
jgi:cell pole-organizing protein PopZ